VVLEGDIEACFDRIDHVVLMERVRMRIKDRKVLALVKAFLKAGILTELSGWEGTYTGTPQGGILSPLLANIALSILDDYYAQKWQEEMSTYHYRQQRLLRGLGSWRLVRYADDWVAMVQGTKEYAESLKLEIEQVLEIIGLRLSKEKTSIVTLDEGFDFLGFRIQRRRKRGTTKDFVYTRPSKQSLKRIGQRVHDETRRSSQHTPATMVKALNLILRGWTAYHKHGAAKDIFVKLGWYVIQRVTWWLRRRHSKNDNPLPMREVKRRFIRNGQFVLDGQRLIQAGKVPIIRYRYRGMNIPTPWTSLQV
jgi:RNA-directed DNA polymerase